MKSSDSLETLSNVFGKKVCKALISVVGDASDDSLCVESLESGDL